MLDKDNKWSLLISWCEIRDIAPEDVLELLQVSKSVVESFEKIEEKLVPPSPLY